MPPPDWSTKRSYQLRCEHAASFMKYLEENGRLESNTQSKEDLKHVYNTEYKEYARRKSPPLLWVNFAGVLYALCRTRQIHRHGRNPDTITFNKLQPALTTHGQTSDTVGSGNHVNHNVPEVHNSQDIIYSRQKSSTQRASARLAVDQHVTRPHITINRESTPDEVTGEDVSLPKGVRRVGRRYFVEVTKVHCSSRDDLDKHLKGRKYRVQCLIQQLRIQREDMIRNKCGIKISTIYDHQETGSIRVNIEEKKPKVLEINIENTNQEDIMFCHCELLKRVRVFMLQDSGQVTDGRRAVPIPGGFSYVVKLTADAHHIGRYHTPVAFVFTKRNQPEQPIHIVRYLSFRCNNALIEQLQPRAPYKRPPRVTLANSQQVEQVDGYPLPSAGQEELEKKVSLDSFLIPGSLRKLVNHGLKEEPSSGDKYAESLKTAKELLNNELSADNYHKRFSLLLHIEEIQMEVDIRKYDRDNVAMKVCRENKRLLTLNVPGLAENRPSVLKGDFLFVRKMKDEKKMEEVEYKGYVHNVTLNDVWLGFSDRLVKSFVDGLKFNIRFTFNRLPLKLQHRSTQLAEEHSLFQLLIPTQDTTCSMGTIHPVDTKLRFYDRQLESNREQCLAVQHIVAGSSRPAPYIVFGPPGTGKTVTIVEAIKQIVRLIPSAHILACAPSNSAADLLAERLLPHVSKAQIFRMIALSRHWNTVPQQIRDICNYNKASGNFYFPKMEDLQKYKVIVCTLVTAGRIASASFPPGHFSHVFIDEAGHAIEPESVIAIAGILECDAANPDGGQVVLAGDPKQLGPILRSPVAIKYGLGVSLLERLMLTCDVYKKNVTYDARLITKLVRNYRSHPAILKVPNECFYDGDLETYADQLLRESMCHWEGLPKRGFPIVFHGVIGEDMREERSPSFFNPEEVAVVTTYIQDLLDARQRGINVKQKDIGVISPYRKQVQKLKEVFGPRRWTDIKVGSVEEFQGQERKIIIISTVRSNVEYLALDSEFKLGFLRNPKRFNVAVTRAKALLILVGNPFVLAQDEHWKLFLQYCCQEGAYTGCDYDESEDVMEDIVQRFSAVQLNILEEEQPQKNGVTESIRQQQEDPEWRSEN